MTWQLIATITAGILSSIILVGAAASAAVRLWKYRVVRFICTPAVIVGEAAWDAWMERRRESLDERAAAAILANAKAAEAIKVIVTDAVHTEVEVLFQGGLRDIVTDVVEGQLRKLFEPNGGASLYDVAHRLTDIERKLSVVNQHTRGESTDPHLPEEPDESQQT